MITTDLSKVISRHEVANVWFNPVSKHHSLHAAVAFEAEEVIIKFKAGSIQTAPTYLTIQTGRERHITLMPRFLQFVNHSCDPNTFFDTTSMELITTKPIKQDEELCFFYPSTEWEMAQPFNCNCGSEQCLQFITGASHMDSLTLQKYRLSDYIFQQLKKTYS